ncbi:hypothetical protein Zmor_004955 [Zophobas morio]|uniref:Uncharacterized protein n=1 Tax=Zophobas morio TaxID=2755281 RepID=A0AA38IP29_9CUCU|nr:hypothetical protein Zmor_004955 [Zophobas morio]
MSGRTRTLRSGEIYKRVEVRDVATLIRDISKQCPSKAISRKSSNISVICAKPLMERYQISRRSPSRGPPRKVVQCFSAMTHVLRIGANKLEASLWSTFLEENYNKRDNRNRY